MPVADYIPQSDAEFDVWQANFVTYASANLSTLGLVASDLTPVSADQTLWGTTFTDHTAAQAAAESASQAKSQARNAYVSTVRALVRRLQASPSVSDAERRSLGINVKAARTPTPTPTSRPVASVAVGDRLRHKVSFTDESTPTSKAKPAGMMGCEVWVKIGDPAPSDPSQLRYMGLSTRTPYVAEFDGPDAGKTAYYMLRWVNRQGEKGPWSATAAATVAG
ncbi:MAG: hypothetical protein ACRC33_09185 [Gemmataceae bacterium]